MKRIWLAMFVVIAIAAPFGAVPLVQYLDRATTPVSVVPELTPQERINRAFKSLPSSTSGVVAHDDGSDARNEHRVFFCTKLFERGINCE